jgi:hypothetical protein
LFDAAQAGWSAERLHAKIPLLRLRKSKPGRHDRARLSLLRRIYSQESLKNNDFLRRLAD